MDAELRDSDGARLPLPDSFPEGSLFFDKEDSPFVMIPGEGLFNARGGTLLKVPAADVVKPGTVDVDEAAFRRLVAASQGLS